MPHGPVHHLEQGGQGVHDGLGGGGEEQLRVLGRLGAAQLGRQQLAQAVEELVTVVAIQLTLGCTCKSVYSTIPAKVYTVLYLQTGFKQYISYKRVQYSNGK